MQREMILLVHDDESGRGRFALELRQAGFLVQEARGADDAREIFAPDRHGLVILPLALASRFELVRSLRDEAPNLAVLALSDRDEGELAGEAERAGADEVVHGPPSASRLVDAAARLLSCPESREETGGAPGPLRSC